LLSFYTITNIITIITIITIFIILNILLFFTRASFCLWLIYCLVTFT